MVSSARFPSSAPPRSRMLYPLFRPLLFALDPETAHELTLACLDAAASLGVAQLAAPRVPASPVKAMGITFPNRIGLAAGLDKNAVHIDGLAALGFGFIECGTVTPRAQPGNHSQSNTEGVRDVRADAALVALAAWRKAE